MIDESELGVGVQVLYVPSHVREQYKSGLIEDYLKSPDTEIGFISSWRWELGAVFCRFYWKRTPALRTTANSESCSPEDLIPYNYFPQDNIEQILHFILEKPKFYGWHEQGRE
jgi:hypothetical protein